MSRCRAGVKYVFGIRHRLVKDWQKVGPVYRIVLRQVEDWCQAGFGWPLALGDRHCRSVKREIAGI